MCAIQTPPFHNHECALSTKHYFTTQECTLSTSASSKSIISDLFNEAREQHTTSTRWPISNSGSKHFNNSGREVLYFGFDWLDFSGSTCCLKINDKISTSDQVRENLCYSRSQFQMCFHKSAIYSVLLF